MATGISPHLAGLVNPDALKAKTFKGRGSSNREGIKNSWSKPELAIVIQFVDTSPQGGEKDWQSCAKKVNQYRQENNLTGQRSSLDCRKFYLTTEHCLFKTVPSQHLKAIEKKFGELANNKKKPIFTPQIEKDLKTYATTTLKLELGTTTWNAIKVYVTGSSKKQWTKEQIEKIKQYYQTPENQRPNIQDFATTDLEGSHTVKAIQTLASELGIAKENRSWTEAELKLLQAYCCNPQEKRTWKKFAEEAFTVNGKQTRTSNACFIKATQMGYPIRTNCWKEQEDQSLMKYCNNVDDDRTWEEFVQEELPDRTVHAAKKRVENQKYNKNNRIWWHSDSIGKLEKFSKNKPSLEMWKKFLEKNVCKPFTQEDCLKVVQKKNWIFDQQPPTPAKKKDPSSHHGVREDVWDLEELKIIMQFGQNKQPQESWDSCVDRVNAYRKSKGLPQIRTLSACKERYLQTPAHFLKKISLKNLKKLRQYAEGLSEKDRENKLREYATNNLEIDVSSPRLWKFVKRYIKLNPHTVWTAEQVEALKGYYAIPREEREPANLVCERLFKGKITLNQFYKKATTLKITLSDGNKWTTEEESLLQSYCNDPNDVRTWKQLAEQAYTVNGKLTRTATACKIHAFKKGWILHRHWLTPEIQCLKDYCADPKDPRSWDEFVEESLIRRTTETAKNKAEKKSYTIVDRIYWHPELIEKLQAFHEAKATTPSLEEWKGFLNQENFKCFEEAVYINFLESRDWISKPKSSEDLLLDAYLDSLNNELLEDNF